MADIMAPTQSQGCTQKAPPPFTEWERQMADLLTMAASMSQELSGMESTQAFVVDYKSGKYLHELIDELMAKINQTAQG